MAVNLTDKIHVVRDNIPTKNLGSALANSGRDAISIQEIIDLVPAAPQIEAGFFTPELSLMGQGSFSQITYGVRWGYYTVINGFVTVSYTIGISSFTIGKAPGAVIIPYMTLPFNYPSALNPNYPYVHSVGYNRNIGTETSVAPNQIINNLNGGESVGINGASWSIRQKAGTPPITVPVNDSNMYAYSNNAFLISGTVTYPRQG